MQKKPIDAKPKRKTKNYIAKTIPTGLPLSRQIELRVQAVVETYAATYLRLLVLNGDRIPKYSCAYGAEITLSEEVAGFTSFYDIKTNFSSRYITEISRLLENNSKNLRAFAQIYVGNIVFANNDLKAEHCGFSKDSSGAMDLLVAIDFNCSFTDKSFTASDIEHAPILSYFDPYNFVFNRIMNHPHYDSIEDGVELSKRLGKNLQCEIYAAVLKILIIPNFLLEELDGIINSFC